jgi:very-short-patch-repair endonuclease
MIKRKISDFKRRSAKRTRSNATKAENILWKHLRGLDIKGSHFRRQVVIKPYIADFACLAAHLVIEIDGSQHGEADNFRRDVSVPAGCNRKVIACCGSGTTM